MPCCLYLRGAPGTGKDTVARILQRDLGWPRLWVHQFDETYKAIGEYKVPELTDVLMLHTAGYLMSQDKNLMLVRPSRDVDSVGAIADMADSLEYTFVPVRLTASYQTLVTRVTRRWTESPFRLTTREALDEYLTARPETEYPGEHVIDTDSLTPEQVAGRVKELLPCSTPVKA